MWWRFLFIILPKLSYKKYIIRMWMIKIETVLWRYIQFYFCLWKINLSKRKEKTCLFMSIFRVIINNYKITTNLKLFKSKREKNVKEKLKMY